MLQPKDTDWLNGYKNKIHIYSVYKKSTSDQKTHVEWKWKDGKNIYIFHANGKQKKAGVAVLTSDKINCKIKNVTRDKEGHYVMIKGSIQEEDVTIVNIYAPNIGAPQYVRQTLLLLLSHFSHVRLLWDPIDGSPPGSPIPEILQARTLE